MQTEDKIFIYFNQKGGVGKTTNSINTIVQLAKNNPDKRYLFIDTDPQCNSSSFFLENYVEFYSQEHSEKLTLYSTLVEKKELPILATRYNNIDLVASHSALSLKEPEIATGNDLKHARLSKQLNKIKHLYDKTIIDSVHSLGIIGINGLFAADQLIVCVSPGEYSLQGIKELHETIKFLDEDLNKKFNNIKYLQTMIDTRNKTTWNKLQKDMSDAFGQQVLKTFIPFRTIVAISQTEHKAACEIDPINRFVEAINKLISEIF